MVPPASPLRDISLFILNFPLKSGYLLEYIVFLNLHLISNILKYALSISTYEARNVRNYNSS